MQSFFFFKRKIFMVSSFGSLLHVPHVKQKKGMKQVIYLLHLIYIFSPIFQHGVMTFVRIVKLMHACEVIHMRFTFCCCGYAL